MKKLIYLFLIIGIFGILGFVYIRHNQLQQDQNKTEMLIKSLSRANQILQDQKTLPLPGSSLTYYDKSGKLGSSNKYDIVSGRLCSRDMVRLGIDASDPFLEKCLKYSVTKDRKHFQIGAVIKDGSSYRSILTGNSTDSLTRSYKQDKIISDGDTQDFPYNPYSQSLGIYISDTKDTKIIDENGNTKSGSDLQPGDTLLLKNKNGSTEISLENGDHIKLKGQSAIKVKQAKLGEESSDIELFWLVGDMTYTNHNSSNIKITSPTKTIESSGNIIGKIDIKDDRLNIQTKVYEDKNIIKDKSSASISSIVDIKSLFDEQDVAKAQIVSSNVNIEKIVKTSE